MAWLFPRTDEKGTDSIEWLPAETFFLLRHKLPMVIWHATSKREVMIQMPSTVRTTADSYQIQ